MIGQERKAAREDLDRKIRVWTEKLAETARKRSRYQDMAAEGVIAFGELRTKLVNREKVREAAEQELESLRSRKERMEELEKDRDALVESWAELVPAGLEGLSGLECNKVYRMLNLLVSPSPEGYEVKGSFCTKVPCGSL
jgi:hypothetical protein